MAVTLVRHAAWPCMEKQPCMTQSACGSMLAAVLGLMLTGCCAVSGSATAQSGCAKCDVQLKCSAQCWPLPRTVL